MKKSEKVEQLTASPLDERLENLQKLFPLTRKEIHQGTQNGGMNPKCLKMSEL